MGFSILLKSMLGHDQQIIKQLFAFNLGLELGQILIVACLLSVFTLLAYLGIDRYKSKIFFCGAIAAIALEMCLERLPWKQKEENLIFLNHKFLPTNINLNENETFCLATDDGFERAYCARCQLLHKPLKTIRHLITEMHSNN